MPSPTINNFTTKYSNLLFISGIIIFVGLLFLRLKLIFSPATDLAGIEQNVIYSIQTFINNGTLYTSPLKAPFAVTQYTPFYYYLCGYTAKLFGKGADDIEALYTIGRSWDLLFNLITAFFISQIARSVFNFSKGLAWFTFLVSFAFAFAHNFAVRPDSMQDMLAVISIYCFLTYQLKATNGNGQLVILAAGIIISAISVFTKQSGIQVILVFGCFCLFTKQWKTLIQTIVIAAVAYVGLLAIFVLKYPQFLTNIVGGVANGISLYNFYKYVIGRLVFVITVWPLPALAIYLLFKNKRTETTTNADRLLPAFVFGSLIFATLTALKMGSTVQYYVLFINLSVLYIINSFVGHNAISITKINSANNYKLLFFQLFLVLGMLIYAANNFKLLRGFSKYDDIEQQRQAAVKTADYINKQMSTYPGKYIFANITTDFHIPSRQRVNNILFRNCLVPQMDILQYSTGPLKVFGYKGLDSLLKTGQVEFVVASHPKINYNILADIDNTLATHFTQVADFDGYLVLKLKHESTTTIDEITPNLK